jgi:hypothetical protein
MCNKCNCNEQQVNGEEVMEENNKVQELTASERAQKQIEEAWPEISGVLAAAADKLDNDIQFRRNLKYLAGILGETLSPYISELVKSAYMGRTEAVLESYYEFEEEFGKEVALELIKKMP